MDVPTAVALLSSSNENTQNQAFDFLYGECFKDDDEVFVPFLDELFERFVKVRNDDDSAYKKHILLINLFIKRQHLLVGSKRDVLVKCAFDVLDDKNAKFTARCVAVDLLSLVSDDHTVDAAFCLAAEGVCLWPRSSYGVSFLLSAVGRCLQRQNTRLAQTTHIDLLLQYVELNLQEPCTLLGKYFQDFGFCLSRIDSNMYLSRRRKLVQQLLQSKNTVWRSVGLDLCFSENVLRSGDSTVVDALVYEQLRNFKSTALRKALRFCKFSNASAITNAHHVVDAVHTVKRYEDVLHVTDFYKEMLTKLMSCDNGNCDAFLLEHLICAQNVTKDGVDLVDAMFAVHGYDVSLKYSNLDSARSLIFENVSNVIMARAIYYTGLERTASLSSLRREAARLYQLACSGTTRKRPLRWCAAVRSLEFIKSLPMHLALKACCVATLCPALPLKEDFA
jgi:hypothetical protein